MPPMQRHWRFASVAERLRLAKAGRARRLLACERAGVLAAADMLGVTALTDVYEHEPQGVWIMHVAIDDAAPGRVGLLYAVLADYGESFMDTVERLRRVGRSGVPETMSPSDPVLRLVVERDEERLPAEGRTFTIGDHTWRLPPGVVA
jgi:hypothetical protein